MSAITKREEFPLNEIESKKELLKRTICKGATDEEFELFYHACKRTGLDPFMKQIHAVKRWNSKSGREDMTIQTGIDGFRLIAERTGCYSPGKEPTYNYDKDGNIISSTSYIKKRTSDGIWHEVSATAFWQEYVSLTKDGKPTQFWNKMPHLMLAKCAEALALRKAFPAELSGIYTIDEMAQAQNEMQEIYVEDTCDTNVQKVQNVPKILEKNVQESCISLDRLSERLGSNGINVERLDTFLQKRSEESKKPKEAIIKAAMLNEDMTKRFEKAYTQWCVGDQ
jgi:phage recombination protein Bet